MKIQQNKSLKPFNSFGIDVNARWFCEIQERHDFNILIDWIGHKRSPYLLIGGGSNILFTKDYEGLAAVIKTQGKQLVGEDKDAYYIEAKAGENWHDFVVWTIDQGYAGLENLSLIPGTVGAAPMQNIGAYGIELANRFHELKAFKRSTKDYLTFDKAACQFAYRHSFFKANLDDYFIESVTFKLPKNPEWKVNYAGVKDKLADKTLSAKVISDAIIEIRQSKLPDPSTIGNAGSFFKNPIIADSVMQSLQSKHSTIPSYPAGEGLCKTSAAWLIDQCGWKGKAIGQAAVYPKHALVLTNTGSATGNEIWTLAQEIMQSVFNKFEIQLEPEPRVES